MTPSTLAPNKWLVSPLDAVKLVLIFCLISPCIAVELPCPDGSSDEWTNCIGKRSWPDGSSYLGSWHQGRPHGHGTFVFNNGDIYTGQLRDGQREGKGEYTFTSDPNKNNGGKYVGDFRSGELEGSGTFTWPDGSFYVGSFANGTFKGQGVLTWPDGRKLDAFFLGGSLLRQGFNAKGTMVWANGARFIGELRNGLRDGQGDMTYSNKDRYVGEWVADLQHGEGTFYYTTGERYAGSWSRNQRHGKGDLFRKSGEPVIRGTWSNGTRVDSPSSPNSSGDLSLYKGQCLDLGFKDKTEKFGECVLALSNRAESDMNSERNMKVGDGDPDDSTCEGYGFRSGTADYETCRHRLKNARNFYERELQTYERARAEYERGVATAERTANGEGNQDSGRRIAELGICIATCTEPGCASRCGLEVSAIKRDFGSPPQRPSGITTYIINGKPITCTASPDASAVVTCN